MSETPGVTNPSYYHGKSGQQAIDVIEDFALDYHLGSAVAYILRAGKKDPLIRDLRKARWYLTRSLENAGEASGPDRSRDLTVKESDSIKQMVEDLFVVREDEEALRDRVYRALLAMMAHGYKSAYDDLGLEWK